MQKLMVATRRMKVCLSTESSRCHMSDKLRKSLLNIKVSLNVDGLWLLSEQGNVLGPMETPLSFSIYKTMCVGVLILKIIAVNE